jgi:ATP-dependent RNA circularization protein (DNA/RNA ligase family)
MEYHKIQSIYKRDEISKKFIIGSYSTPEIEYLKDNVWEFSEKIDGTNIRITIENGNIEFGGRTDNAQIPTKLYGKLSQLFMKDKLDSVFLDAKKIILYGEGFGANIQSGGKYIQNGVDFILFDIWIDGWWLNRNLVEDIAKKLNLKIVKILGEGTIQEGIDFIFRGFNSEFGKFQAEGLVLRPKVQMFARNGDRIITKIKYRDFK